MAGRWEMDIKQKVQNLPVFAASYYVDQDYSKNHAHMLHKHADVLEFLYVYSGEGGYIVGKREYAVQTGDMVLCNAGVLHGEAPFREHGLFTYCCALKNVRLEGLKENWITDDRNKPVLHMGEQSEAAASMMKALYVIYTQKEKNEAACNYLTAAIFEVVLKMLENQQEGTGVRTEQKREAFVRNISEYIDQHYTERLTLSELSRVFYTSPSNLSHVFKQETGLSPIQYMIHRRIGEAQTFLSDTDMPIQEIENDLGFGGSSHFSAMFKKYVGVSPREYRNHFQKRS